MNDVAQEEKAVLWEKHEDIDVDFVHGVLKQYKNARGAIIPVLQKIQVKFGYLPKDAMEIVSREMRIPMAHLVGVASFYAQFRMTPRGKYMMKVCCGTACHVKGAQKLVEKVTEKLNIHHGETTTDKMFTMERVACIGACSLAPVITVNDEAEGYLSVNQLEKIIENLSEAEENEGEA